MSPRKSSTSSGNRFDRPRYLLVEAPGAGTLSPRLLESVLDASIPGPPADRWPFRVIRVEGRHALVAVAHLDAPAARAAWNASARPDRPAIRTLRSYGTLRKGKLWLRRQYGPRVEDRRRRR